MNDRYRMLQVLKRNPAQRFAMATIIAVEGSSYRHPGAKMLIGADGSQYGAISAGCLEEDLLHRAQEVVRCGEPLLMEYDLRSEDDLDWGRGAGCNGRIHVYVEPCEWGNEWAQVEQHLNRGESIVYARKMKHDNGCPEVSTVQSEIGMQLLAAEAELVVLPLPAGQGDGDKLLAELYKPRERLYIFGAGTDTELLARLASGLDFEVWIVDPRSDRCSERYFAAADRLFDMHSEKFLEEHSIAANSYVLVMTHQFQQDRAILRGLLQAEAPPAYLGVLGSRSRTERLLLPEPLPDFVHAPVGLAIGAEGPEEIAVSIVSELIQFRSGLLHGREADDECARGLGSPSHWRGHSGCGNVDADGAV